MEYNEKFRTYQDSEEPGQAVTLWHGSRYGIDGDTIRPISAKRKNGKCIDHDFGIGFYAGTKLSSAAELIGRTGRYSPRAAIVNLVYDEDKFKNFSTYTFTQDMTADWALFVAYNRRYLSRKLIMADKGKIIHIVPEKDYPDIISQMEFINEHDIIIGPIADDQMINVFNDFISNDGMGVKCLAKCLLEGNLGTQYVFRTEKVCQALSEYSHVKIVPFNKFLSESGLSADEIKKNVSVRNTAMRETVLLNKSLYRHDPGDLTIKDLFDKRE